MIVLQPIPAPETGEEGEDDALICDLGPDEASAGDADLLKSTRRELLRLAGSAEQQSEHPLARAIVDEAERVGVLLVQLEQEELQELMTSKSSPPLRIV